VVRPALLHSHGLNEPCYRLRRVSNEHKRRTAWINYRKVGKRKRGLQHRNSSASTGIWVSAKSLEAFWSRHRLDARAHNIDGRKAMAVLIVIIQWNLRGKPMA